MQHLSYESTSFTKTSVPIHSKTSVRGLKEVTLSFQGFYSILANTLPTVSIVGKVFARVLNERVKVMMVDKVMDEQGGFRSGRDAVTKSSQSSKLWRILCIWGRRMTM